MENDLLENDLLLPTRRGPHRIAVAARARSPLLVLGGLALAAAAVASSRSPATSTRLLELASSPTTSPTPRAQQFESIDDDNASSCYAYETAQYGIDACNATDTAFCESVRKANDGEWPELLEFAGCDRCDGAFGICVMRAVANLDALCANWTVASAGHYDPRRLGDSSCPNLAKGECQTSSACEWHSSSSACIPVIVPPSAAPTSPAPSLKPTIPTPSASPTYLKVSAFPDCDIHAYCSFCAPSEACADLMSRAHRGNITGVERQAYSSHGYHAAQAAEIIQKLPLVCPRAPGRHR